MGEGTQASLFSAQLSYTEVLWVWSEGDPQL